MKRSAIILLFIFLLLVNRRSSANQTFSSVTMVGHLKIECQGNPSVRVKILAYLLKKIFECDSMGNPYACVYLDEDIIDNYDVNFGNVGLDIVNYTAFLGYQSHEYIKYNDTKRYLKIDTPMLHVYYNADFDVKKILKLVYYGLRNIETIQLTQTPIRVVGYGGYKIIRTVRKNKIEEILKMDFPVIDDVCNKKVYSDIISNTIVSWDGFPHTLKYYYKSGQYHIYKPSKFIKYPPTNEFVKLAVDTNGKELLAVNDISSIVEYENDYLIFDTHNRFYHVSFKNNSVTGPISVPDCINVPRFVHDASQHGSNFEFTVQYKYGRTIRIKYVPSEKSVMTNKKEIDSLITADSLEYVKKYGHSYERIFPKLDEVVPPNKIAAYILLVTLFVNALFIISAFIKWNRG